MTRKSLLSKHNPAILILENVFGLLVEDKSVGMEVVLSYIKDNYFRVMCINHSLFKVAPLHF